MRHSSKQLQEVLLVEVLVDMEGLTKPSLVMFLLLVKIFSLESLRGPGIQLLYNEWMRACPKQKLVS